MQLFKKTPKKRGYFVHIPKTAGGSMRYFSRHVGLEIVGHNLRDPNYQYFKDYEDRMSYFSFAFARNPLDRAVSAFQFLSEGGINEEDQKDAQQYVSPYKGDFNAFVHSELTKGEVLKQLHFMPQHNWITDSAGKLCVDMICRFENLEQEVTKLNQLLNITKHFEMPLKNPSAKGKRIIDSKSESIIREVYYKDYLMFNY
ncbi:sulfotransferase family 2 domain-containing protein [Aureitalea marina]|nr:sulfotransferase family 2 domain-containing protein [Aureitalea marina]